MASAHWRLITTLGAPPNFNMGLDEALLKIGGAPTLRLYTWQPDTLSLGYFQRFADVHGTDTAGHVVRRITGGGAIHHAGELTFSLTTGLDDALYRGKVADSSPCPCTGPVIAALAAAGIKANCAATPPSPRTAPAPACASTTPPTSTSSGRTQEVGSAQRRSGGRVLTTARSNSAPRRSKATSPTTGPQAAPARGLHPLAPSRLREHLGQTGPHAPTQRERVASLLEPGYSDPAFLHRR
ncbi:MAG: hypothetical protein R3E96_00585 [Planctomycetota bacterium]